MASSKLDELIERVKAATGPDREIDGAIQNAVFGTSYIRSSGSVTGFMTSRTDNGNPMVDSYTSSIDDIVALIEAKLPKGVDITLKLQTGGKYFHAEFEGDEGDTTAYNLPSMPLALCLAFLQALAGDPS